MAVRAWAREAADLTPVFIVGAARSGTSILYRSLQSHPAFTPAGGINLSESHAMRNLPALLRPEDAKKGQLANFALGVDAVSAVAADVAPLARRRLLVRRIAGDRIARVPLWKASGEHHVVRRYFLEAHRRRGAMRLVEKTPSHIRWVPHLGTAFPRARFIFVIRHPIDVLSSFWKRAKDDPKQERWASVTPEGFAARWKAAASLALALADREPRFLLLRYEEFTGTPERSVRRMLHHVGEPFDEACLLGGTLEPPADVSEVLPDIGQRTVFQPLTRSTKRWEDYVDPPTAAEVERRLANDMALAGYEPRVLGRR